MIRIFIACISLALSVSAQVQRPRSEGTFNANRAAAVLLQDMQTHSVILKQVRLTPGDELIATNAVADFDRQFRENGTAVDKGVLAPSDFFTLRDQLLEKTREQLQRQLTPAGWKKFDAFIGRAFVQQLPFAPVSNSNIIRTWHIQKMDTVTSVTHTRLSS